MKSLVLRENGESQNGCFKKTKHAKFSEKRTFLTPWYTIGSILKRVFRENKARQIFRKTSISDPLICVSGGKKMFVFRKIWRALFSWNTRFEIRPFVLLPTTYCINYNFYIYYFILRISKIKLIDIAKKFLVQYCIKMKIAELRCRSLLYQKILKVFYWNKHF